MIVRLLFSILLFLVACLVFVHAPENHLWKLAIIATECGHYLFFLPLLLLFITKPKAIKSKVVSGLSLCSCLLFIYPTVCSYLIGRGLEKELDIAFKSKDLLPKQEVPNPVHLFFPPKQNTNPTFSVKVGADSLPLNLFIDTLKNAHPLVIVIHGGAWSSGNNTGFAEQNAYLASKGYAVASVSYRLVPKYQSPAQMDDIMLSLQFLKSRSRLYHIDTNNIFLLGRSAGGQIALQTAYLHPEEKFKGVVAIYTPADIVWGYAFPGNPWILDSRKVLREYLGGNPIEAAKNFHASNPVELVTKQSPPTLMIHGKRDELVAYEHNIRLIAQLKRSQIPYYLLSLPWATHGCDYFFSGPSGQLSTYAIEYFLKRYSKDL